MKPGKCRYCGCTEERACETSEGPCFWSDFERTVCSNTKCLALHVGAIRDRLDQMSPGPWEIDGGYTARIFASDGTEVARVGGTKRAGKDPTVTHNAVGVFNARADLEFLIPLAIYGLTRRG